MCCDVVYTTEEAVGGREGGMHRVALGGDHGHVAVGDGEADDGPRRRRLGHRPELSAGCHVLQDTIYPVIPIWVLNLSGVWKAETLHSEMQQSESC